MDRKRARSMNWDEEEKQLLRAVLKDHAEIIENKSLDTNSNKTKCKAWEEVHKRFNELNVRNRQLSQLKMQWKAMKMYARKTCSSFTKECNETGGGARPRTPDNTYMEIKDLLNPAELLKDENIYDSDGIIPISDNKLVATPSETAVTLQNNICTRDNIEVQIVQEVTPILSSQDGGMTKNTSQENPLATPIKKRVSTPTKMGNYD
ncbi:uncharacterized protein [Epargyreus clarus]|uniref:uncharacterized protein n=1 Tax=Epargyreus clarus TaxID=520877 RepID=UPI003C2CDFB3